MFNVCDNIPVKYMPATQIREVVSLGMVYLMPGWILDRYICLSGFLFFMFLWLTAHLDSDRHWPGRDHFFKMIVLEFLLQMKQLENLSGYGNKHLFSSSQVCRLAMI